MEHRCGQRIEVHIPALLRVPGEHPTPCVVAELGCGGAFVRLPEDRVDLRGVVELTVALPFERRRLSRWRGYVIHRQSGGIGIRFDDEGMGERLPFIAAESRYRRQLVGDRAAQL